jgi:hypothetical protein
MLAQPMEESKDGSTLLDCGKIQAARYGFKAPVEDLRPRALHLQTEAEIKILQRLLRASPRDEAGRGDLRLRS